LFYEFPHGAFAEVGVGVFELVEECVGGHGGFWILDFGFWILDFGL
jgi:hypothetical protein